MPAKVVGVVFLCIAVVIHPLFFRMPHPYGGVTAVDIVPERIERMPTSAPDFSGKFRHVDERLKQAVRLFEGRVHGSESVAVTPSGELLMLDKYGFLFRAAHRDGKYELTDQKLFYIGPGRPLGYHVAEAGAALLVCDSLKGLLRVDLQTGELTLLSNSVSGTGPFNYANDLDVAANGTVYFTSSTELSVALSPAGFYDTMRSYMLNLLRGDASGRLLAYDPETRITTELLGDVFYANGVALAPDESFVAVVETSGFRVLRHFLDGPRRGETDVLIDGLPGSPDGISRASDGNFWLCLLVPATPLPRLLAPHRWLRQFLSHILVEVSLPIGKWGCVLKVSPSGEILKVLLDAEGSQISGISAVTEHDGSLFFGNLAGDYVSMIPLPT